MNLSSEKQSASKGNVYAEIERGLLLRFELNLSYQQIGRSCTIGMGSVYNYIKRAEAAGLTWPLPDDWDEAHIEPVLFPGFRQLAKQRPTAHALPDFAADHQQLRNQKNVTLQLVWRGFLEITPCSIRDSCFCELYRRWFKKLNVVLRQEHKAGEKLFVDWAGATGPIYDRLTATPWQALLFLAAHGASASCIYAEATTDQQMELWLRAHVHTH